MSSRLTWIQTDSSATRWYDHPCLSGHSLVGIASFFTDLETIVRSYAHFRKRKSQESPTLTGFLPIFSSFSPHVFPSSPSPPIARDLAKLYEILETARNPSRLLMAKLEEMEDGQFAAGPMGGVGGWDVSSSHRSQFLWWETAWGFPGVAPRDG